MKMILGRYNFYAFLGEKLTPELPRKTEKSWTSGSMMSRSTFASFTWKQGASCLNLKNESPEIFSNWTQVVNSSLWQSVSPVQYLSPLKRLKNFFYTASISRQQSDKEIQYQYFTSSHLNRLKKNHQHFHHLHHQFTSMLLSPTSLYEEKNHWRFCPHSHFHHHHHYQQWGGYTSGLGSESRANEGTPWNFNLISL